jgi:hypothetical protein
MHSHEQVGKSIRALADSPAVSLTPPTGIVDFLQRAAERIVDIASTEWVIK